MDIFGISVKGTIKPNIRILATPVLMALVLVFLTVFIFKNGISRMLDEIKNLEDARKTETILQEKVNILRRIEGVVLSQADISAMAIPERVPSMLMLVQINKLAEKYSINLSSKETQIQSRGDVDLPSMRISLTAEGELTGIVNFLKEIDTLAPISTLDEIEYNQDEGGKINTTISLSIFWGDFPTKIPPITEPIKTLSIKEEKLLEQLADLQKPELIDLKASEPTTRESPFR